MKNTIAIEETLLELKDQYTFVIVTHNLAQAKRIADQVIFMDHGEVLEVTEKRNSLKIRHRNRRKSRYSICNKKRPIITFTP